LCSGRRASAGLSVTAIGGGIAYAPLQAQHDGMQASMPGMHGPTSYKTPIHASHAQRVERTNQT
ncbi:MAG TPA: hypothetical protein DCP37_05685, partial [Dehalococcoidia bacterium]|nr:hypothetical protein [Dehalococcoidia bacterium]